MARPFERKWIVLFCNLCFLFYLHRPLFRCQQHSCTCAVGLHVFLHWATAIFTQTLRSALYFVYRLPSLALNLTIHCTLTICLSRHGCKVAAAFSTIFIAVLRLLTNLVAEHVALIAQSVSIKILNCSYFFMSREQLWVNNHVGGLKWTWWGLMHIHRLYCL